MKKIAAWVLQVIDHIKGHKLPAKPEARAAFMKAYKKQIKDDKFLLEISAEVKKLCKKYPAP